MSSSDLGELVGKAIQDIHVRGERARLERVISDLRPVEQARHDDFFAGWDAGYSQALDDVLRFVRRP